MRINGHEVNIAELRKQFDKEYEFLYNANGYVAGEDEAMAFGDEVIRLRPDLVHAFCDGRTVLPTNDGGYAPIFDPLTSDREVAAFGFALNELYG
jgi:hypothetical protein